MSKYFILFLTIAFALSSCKKNQDELDEEAIKDYIKEHSLNATKHSSGLYYVIEKAGTEVKPNINHVVWVKYKGYYTDGSVFDQTTNEAIDFRLSNLIKGWQIGIPLIGKGGKIKLLLPSYLGYNDGVRIFDVELVDFYQP